MSKDHVTAEDHKRLGLARRRYLEVLAQHYAGRDLEIMEATGIGGWFAEMIGLSPRRGVDEVITALNRELAAVGFRIVPTQRH